MPDPNMSEQDAALLREISEHGAPARPVEDREPVGPYAPSSGRIPGGHVSSGGPAIVGESPITAAARAIRGLSFDGLTDTIRKSRIGDVGALVHAGMTPTEAAAHVERMAKIRATADSEHQSAFRQGRDAGFAEHARVVAAEREARDLNQVDEFEFSEETNPSPYDVAERALDYATRLVKPIDGTMLPESVEAAADSAARCVELIGNRLYGWLWQFTDMTEGHPSRIETCGSCSQPRERHDPGCLYAPRSRGRSMSEPIIDEVSHWPTGLIKGPMVGPQIDDPVLRCPHPQCNAALTAGPGSMCTDPWCPSGAAQPPAEPDPCPECRAGKHDNCGGRIINEAPGPAALSYRACPCALDTHPESLPS
jgi:hypothetical protein